MVHALPGDGKDMLGLTLGVVARHSLDGLPLCNHQPAPHATHIPDGKAAQEDVHHLQASQNSMAMLQHPRWQNSVKVQPLPAGFTGQHSHAADLSCYAAHKTRHLMHALDAYIVQLDATLVEPT